MAITESIDYMVGEDVGTAFAADIASIAGAGTDTTAGQIISCNYVSRLALLPKATSSSGSTGVVTFNIKVTVNGVQSSTTYQITLTLAGAVTIVGPPYLLDVSGFDSVQFISVVNGDAGGHAATAVNCEVRRIGRMVR